jgi:hypothetical protein
MRRSLLLGLGLVLPVLLLAADLFATLGLAQQSLEDSCWKAVLHPDRVPSFNVTPAMKALGVASRRGAVEAIGARMKAYYASPEFQKKWAQYRKDQGIDEEGDAKRAQMQKQGQAQVDASLKQMEAMLPMMPPAQQAEIRKALDKAKADKARQAGREGPTSTKSGPPKDPKVALRQALQTFLKASEGVDFGATLRPSEGKKYFVRKDYEAKSSEWKMFFRAGREATEGARAYVNAWLVELK